MSDETKDAKRMPGSGDSGGADGKNGGNGGRAKGAGGKNNGGVDRIDAFAFARLGKEAQGTVPLVRLTRFTDGLPEQPAGAAGLVTWSVRGEQGKSGLLAGEPLLHLHVQANPLVICQRCNAPFAYLVDSQTLLHLVKSEDDLDDGFSASGQETARTTKTMTAKRQGFAPDQPEKVVGASFRSVGPDRG